MRTQIPRLSKSRFMAGLQCHKRLYLELYAPEITAELDETTLARFRTGTTVGELARQGFAGGRLIAHDHEHHADAEAETRALLDDPNVPALYEGAFSHDHVAVRADIIARQRAKEFDLIEVKSTASWKEPHLFDLAVQLYVLEGAGMQVGRACLMHLNRDYVYQGGAYDLERLFTSADLTERVRALQPDIAAALAAMRQPLWADVPPPIKTGPHCRAPYVCPFYDHCHGDGPEHPIEELPGRRAQLLQELAELGITDIHDIPHDFDGLTILQRRVRDAVKAGNRYHDPAIATALAKAQFPVHFVDFETFMPALPVFVGTRPYQVIPFQWSDHVLSVDGEVSCRDFLHDGADDPRPRFAESLLDTVGLTGSIVVYTGYEEYCLRELEAALPEFASHLAQLRTRLFDLHPVIKTHIYDPAFHGSFSIKVVLPAIVPRLGYDDLEIANGLVASLAYEELRDPNTSAERAAALRANLLAYCRRDTEALLELFRALRRP
jgi:CRISPR/Cas system-associated exonuclease Cas4 (RecB family)